jgi:hypothetical protein
MGLEPWQLSVLGNSKPENKVSSFVKKKGPSLSKSNLIQINYQIRVKAFHILEIPK